jgi:hypothetical protein
LHGITGSKLGSGVRQVYISVVRVNGLGLTLRINVKQCKTKYIHIILRVHIKKFKCQNNNKYIHGYVKQCRKCDFYLRRGDFL